MTTLQLLLLIVSIWFLLGVISIWRSYWGSVKEQHQKHLISKRFPFRQLFPNDDFSRIVISIILCGGFALAFMEIFTDTAWYYHIPKIKQEPIQTDFGKMYN